MENFNKFLKEAEVATQINEECDSPDGKLEIAVTNYSKPLDLAGRKFIATVIVRYKESQELYHLALYQQTIGVQSANAAIEKIVADPTKYKD